MQTRRLNSVLAAGDWRVTALWDPAHAKYRLTMTDHNGVVLARMDAYSPRVTDRATAMLVLDQVCRELETQLPF